ncbi:hypothetical protein H634G_10569 [Metarhizium anisopliae BRIP 53293]|uniref:Uncharacterized protein n=1 Tax=Metarhizium anisopliae BRIP 53293 TaxID=1291518 RepID=A0A0D9NJZ5_METAN|nr:hypothetical protein H634G_10569 [Metarhizium anisopliae BRIP 53293]KJK87000.1 hypothetical protein H633G_09145 [Metarhizium anisopliae BRIP 53284]
MASTAIESPETVEPHNGKEKPTQEAGILTPDQTPAPDDARNAAEQARKAAGIEHEIQRILQSDSDLSTLGVDQNSTPEDRLHALRTLGCKIHHEHSGYGSTKERKKEAKKALKKLCNAAEKLGVESPYASAVFHWDGKKDLMAEDSDDSGDSDSDDSGDRMDQDSVPEPPESVHEIYKKATPFVQQLATDPDDKDSHNGIAALNIEIIKATKEYNELHKDDEAKKVSKNQWEIPLRFFQEHYSLVMANCNILMTDPNNDEARQKAETEAKLISDSVIKYHWPDDWILTVPGKPPSPSNTNAPLQYPWPTLPTGDGIIVGVRERRVGGPQVCVETTTTDGRIIRRLESASDFGLAEVKRYMEIPNYKSLSNAALKFYRKDEADFKQLHWVTMSRIKNKNTATGKKDPPTDCCVEFKSQGLQIITVSNVCNILGRKNGRAAIEQVCKEQGILPPWDRQPMHTFYRLPKDGRKQSAVERWAMVDSPLQGPPATTPPSNGQVSTNGSGLQDPRVDSLNNKIANLEKKIDLLSTAIEKLLAGPVGEESIFIPQEEEEEEL